LKIRIFLYDEFGGGIKSVLSVDGYNII
jgi:hypothetical protein